MESGLLTALGAMFELWKALLVAVVAKGGTEEDVELVTSDPELAAKLADLIVAKSETIKVTVDYSLSLEQMIATGKYDWVNDDITSEGFPVMGEGKVERELVLVRLGSVSTDEALAELDRRGLCPAKIEELLALGAAHPDLQTAFPIAAIGSDWFDECGNTHFAYLDFYDVDRHLDLYWGGEANNWREFYRFLAVRKDAE